MNKSSIHASSKKDFLDFLDPNNIEKGVMTVEKIVNSPVMTPIYK